MKQQEKLIYAPEKYYIVATEGSLVNQEINGLMLNNIMVTNSHLKN